MIRSNAKECISPYEATIQPREKYITKSIRERDHLHEHMKQINDPQIKKQYQNVYNQGTSYHCIFHM